MLRLLPGALGLTVLLLAGWSLFIGVSPISVGDVVAGRADAVALEVFAVSRVPRTLALALAGCSIAVAGLIMQMICRNRFVEPSTAGTVESASLGLLVVAIVAPGASPLLRMGTAAAFALAGTGLFLAVLNRMPWRSTVATPLIGIMLGGVIGAIAALTAGRYGLGQSLAAWSVGDFSGVLRGRYELLWAALILTVIAYVAADRFTAAGMGEAFAANLGLNYRRIVAGGVGIVAMVTAVVVATVGALPFLGLIVPNLVARITGDNTRAALPLVALGGANLVLLCDIIGRVVRHPYEIPVGTIIGLVGGAAFLALILAPRGRADG